MFDTMTLTKVVGGFCGALLFFLLGQWAAELIYHTGGGHGKGHDQAYVIDTGEEEEQPAEEETGPSFAQLFVDADPGKGERVFNKCRACHQLEEGANGAGPYLYGVVGRDVGTAEGFAYSGSLSAVADVWTPRELDAFLENPAEYAPGTTMGFAGLDDVEDRANVIAYLDQTDGDTYEIEVSGAGDAAGDDAAQEDAAATEMTEDAAEESAMADEPAEEVTAEAPDAEEVEPTPEAEAVAEDVTDDAAGDMSETTETDAADTAAAETDSSGEASQETADAAAGEESGFAAMVAAADPADGKKVYRQCQACHVADKEQNRVGPHLVDVIGREVAAVDSFRYSDALMELGGEWTVDRMNAWLEDPRGFAPGNRMSYPGVRDEEDRAAVIAYLKSLSN